MHNNQNAENYLQAAIYYFITALFMLLACFDTYFALPLNVSRQMIIINNYYHSYFALPLNVSEKKKK